MTTTESISPSIPLKRGAWHKSMPTKIVVEDAAGKLWLYDNRAIKHIKPEDLTLVCPGTEQHCYASSFAHKDMRIPGYLARFYGLQE